MNQIKYAVNNTIPSNYSTNAIPGSREIQIEIFNLFGSFLNRILFFNLNCSTFTNCFMYFNMFFFIRYSGGDACIAPLLFNIL